MDKKEIIMPVVGDIIEWVEFDYDAGRDIDFKTDVIEVNGHLWANGCGSVKTIADNFGFTIATP